MENRTLTGQLDYILGFDPRVMSETELLAVRRYRCRRCGKVIVDSSPGRFASNIAMHETAHTVRDEKQMMKEKAELASTSPTSVASQPAGEKEETNEF